MPLDAILLPACAARGGRAPTNACEPNTAPPALPACLELDDLTESTLPVEVGVMSKMKFAAIACRILMGLPLLLFGLNGFLHFMPLPVDVPPGEGGFSEPAHRLLKQLWDSGFIMQTVCAVHAVTGVALLTSHFVPLALVLHLSVSIQMTLFHLLLDPWTGWLAYAILALNLFLLYAYRKAYYALLAPRFEFG